MNKNDHIEPEWFRPILIRLFMDLVTCWQRKVPEPVKTEASFLLSKAACDHVSHQVWSRGFSGDTEEIMFYKYFHPQIAGQLIYYSILYEALISLPAGQLQTANFWDHELNRYHRFLEKNHGFIDYVKSGRSEDDTFWFLRKGSSADYASNRLFRCAREVPGGSMLLSQYQAEQLYHEYVGSKVLNRVLRNS